MYQLFLEGAYQNEGDQRISATISATSAFFAVRKSVILLFCANLYDLPQYLSTLWVNKRCRSTSPFLSRWNEESKTSSLDFSNKFVMIECNINRNLGLNDILSKNLAYMVSKSDNTKRNFEVLLIAYLGHFYRNKKKLWFLLFYNTIQIQRFKSRNILLYI